MTKLKIIINQSSHAVMAGYADTERFNCQYEMDTNQIIYSGLDNWSELESLILAENPTAISEHLHLK